MADELKVGIIGVNTTGGWAAEAHVPAVKLLDGMTLAAVATSRQETADEAAHAFGASRAYAGGLALIADPAIDVVTVATRVPDHRELLLAAVAAGKHVYCEWPLGSSAAEAREIADAVRSRGVKHAIGLQLRESPAVKRARAVMASGALGRVLSVSALSTTAGFGPVVPPRFAYLEDPASFANLVTIQGAHTLDLIIALGGPLAFMSAVLSRQFPQISVGEPGQARERVTFDHLLAQGHLASGVPFSLETAGGRTADQPFRIDIVGERGAVRLDGGGPRGAQASRLGLWRNCERQTVDEGEFADLPDAAANVAGVYKALRDDIRSGSAHVTDFAHAERLTCLVEAIFDASERRTGIVTSGAWPVA